MSHMPKVASFITIIASLNLVTLLTELIRILLEWKCIYLVNVMPFWPLCCESEVIVSKNVRPGHLGLSVHMPGKICLPVTETAPHTLTQDSVIVKQHKSL